MILYMFSVSLGAILLSLYYVFIWKNPHTQALDKKVLQYRRLEAQTEKDRPAEDSDKVILNESSVYSMGNYCSTMLAGLKCKETSCSWSHVMLATDAASQFSKILQFR